MGDASAAARIGATLAGKYRLERVIGEGGMGVVYGATHLRLRQPCAIKLLNERALASAEIVARFEREARAAATLKNEHVVQVLDVDTTSEGLPYMVMEFLEGRDLATVLDEGGPLPVDQAVRWAIATCAALAHAHKRGVIHRDLKPSNLFLSTKDGEVTLKLLDFGISKMTSEEDSHVTSSIAMFGTPFYMSPEQVRSVRDVDGRTDIWSLGVVLYELLTGRVPFKGVPTAVCAAIVADPVTPPRTLRFDIPEALEAVILKTLEKDRANRYGDVRELAMALAPFTEGLQVSDMMRRASRVSLPEITVPSKATASSPTMAYAKTQVEPSSPRIPAVSESGADTTLSPPVPTAEPSSGGEGETIGRRGGWSTPPPGTHRRTAQRRVAMGAVAAIALGAIAAVAVSRGGTSAPSPRTPAAVAPDTPTLTEAKALPAPVATDPPAPTVPAVRDPAPPPRARAPRAPAAAVQPPRVAATAPPATASATPPATAKPAPPTLSNPLTL